MVIHMIAQAVASIFRRKGVAPEFCRGCHENPVKPGKVACSECEKGWQWVSPPETREIVEETVMEDYGQGFYDGLLEAVRTLREAAEDHRIQARESRKVLESQAHELAAALLGSWANGIEINASRSRPSAA